MDNKLLELLNNVLKTGPLKPQSNIDKAIKGPNWLESKAGKDLLDYIKESSEYQLFNGHLQYLGNGGRSVDQLNLADWLVVRAFRTDSTQAESDLRRYLCSDEFEAFSVFLISCLHVDDEFKFCNGVKLIKATSFQNTDFREDIIVNSYGHGLPVARIESVLFKPFTTKRFHHPN